jgi:hypothetical protein
VKFPGVDKVFVQMQPHAAKSHVAVCGWTTREPRELEGRIALAIRQTSNPITIPLP